MTISAFATTLRQARQRRGLSQLELAVRSGTTQRHLSFLEGERAVPGRDLISRLAIALDLPLREHNHLLGTAGFAPRYSDTAFDDRSLAGLRSTLNHLLDASMPYPAIVIDRTGLLVAANPAFAILTDGVAQHLMAPPVNVYRLALAPDGMASRTRNLAEWSAHILERMHSGVGHNPNPALELLLQELETYASEWEPKKAHAMGFAAPLLLAHQDHELALLTTVTSFATATDVTISELKLETFLPADEVTRKYLEGVAYPDRIGGDNLL